MNLLGVTVRTEPCEARNLRWRDYVYVEGLGFGEVVKPVETVRKAPHMIHLTIQFQDEDRERYSKVSMIEQYQKVVGLAM